jgi:hypothetical protein
MQKLK